jgi:hypothetical protein
MGKIRSPSAGFGLYGVTGGAAASTSLAEHQNASIIKKPQIVFLLIA